MRAGCLHTQLLEVVVINDMALIRCYRRLVEFFSKKLRLQVAEHALATILLSSMLNYF
jgi:hypothetical protein